LANIIYRPVLIIYFLEEYMDMEQIFWNTVKRKVAFVQRNDRLINNRINPIVAKVEDASDPRRPRVKL